MEKKIDIGNKIVGIDEPCFIIAEMSANHLQDLDRAKKIIFEAKQSGADAVKLQTYRPDTITINCKKSDFLAPKGSPWDGMNLFELYKTAYTPWEWHEELINYANELGIIIFSSPFDFTAVDFLENLNVPAYKIASFEINDIPLIRKVAKTGKPVIISTGIAYLEDIALAIDTCKKEGNNNVVLLKCVSEYPTVYNNINLNTIPNMRETFDCVVGLSDHSRGNEVAIASVVLGGKVIEKHLTLKREDGGPDGSFSMEPDELSMLVEQIRNVEKALGKVTYELTDSQKNSREKSRSLYVVENIKAGEIFTMDNVKSIRPGAGLHTKYLDDILGKKAKCDIERGTAMKWEFID